MSKIFKSFKFEVYLTIEQQSKLEQSFGSSRYVYNWALALKEESFKNKEKLSRFDIQAKLPNLKKEFDWLKNIHSQVLQNELANLDTAYQNYFRQLKDGTIAKKKRAYIKKRLSKSLEVKQEKLDSLGKPNFKSKKSDKKSISYTQGVQIKNNTIYLPKIGWCEFIQHRELVGQVKTVTVSKTPTGRYFVSLTCDTFTEEPIKKEVLKPTTIGIDLGIKAFLTLSNGEEFENQKFLRKNLKRLKDAQQKLSSKYVKDSKTQSNNYEKQKLVVAKIHEKITNQRKDYIHKITTDLVRRFDTIIIEDLATDEMIQDKNFSLSISDMGWGIFTQQLEYKCKWYGKNLIKVDQYFVSSKLCSVCNTKNTNLKIEDREWTCSSCKTIHLRDINASINIKNKGLGTILLEKSKEATIPLG